MSESTSWGGLQQMWLRLYDLCRCVRVWGLPSPPKSLIISNFIKANFKPSPVIHIGFVSWLAGFRCLDLEFPHSPFQRLMCAFLDLFVFFLTSFLACAPLFCRDWRQVTIDICKVLIFVGIYGKVFLNGFIVLLGFVLFEFECAAIWKRLCLIFYFWWTRNDAFMWDWLVIFAKTQRILTDIGHVSSILTDGTEQYFALFVVCLTHSKDFLQRR